MTTTRTALAVSALLALLGTLASSAPAVPVPSASAHLVAARALAGEWGRCPTARPAHVLLSRARRTADPRRRLARVGASLRAWRAVVVDCQAILAAGDALVVEVIDGRATRLRCGGPDRGLCAGIAHALGRLRVGAGDSVCAQVFHGPQRVRVRGRLGGRRVALTLTRIDGCAEVRYQAFRRLLGPRGARLAPVG